MWCGPCQRASQVAQEYYENYAPEGLIYAVVLIENADREDPSETDLIEWANTKGITSVPVLAGSRDLLMSSGGDWYLTGWPTFYFIDEEMVIQQVLRGWSEEIVNDFTEDLLQ
jgi:thiol-disulfide isomerase/thioredoxin